MTPAPDATPPVPLADQIACVRREIAMRERVYPRWIASGKMTQRAADREIAAMRAVLATLEGAQWRPIGTAPRDCTRVLLHVPDQPDENVVSIGAWLGESPTDGFWSMDGLEGWADSDVLAWMPLPEPPDA